MEIGMGSRGVTEHWSFVWADLQSTRNGAFLINSGHMLTSDIANQTLILFSFFEELPTRLVLILYLLLIIQEVDKNIKLPPIYIGKLYSLTKNIKNTKTEINQTRAQCRNVNSHSEGECALLCAKAAVPVTSTVFPKQVLWISVLALSLDVWMSGYTSVFCNGTSSSLLAHHFVWDSCSNLYTHPPFWWLLSFPVSFQEFLFLSAFCM